MSDVCRFAEWVSSFAVGLEHPNSRRKLAPTSIRDRDSLRCLRWVNMKSPIGYYLKAINNKSYLL